MGLEIINKLKGSEIHGDFVGRDKITNIIMLQDSEREFIVTHNADIKPVSYFTGRETELQELRQRIEEGRKSVLVSGMGGIGKTHICRKLFDEYSTRNGKGENGPFKHIGYIKYDDDMNSSLQTCLKFKKQERQEDNLEAAWRELEYLASGGKLLLFVDNVNVPIGKDAGLNRLKQIPGAVVLTSRRTAFSQEFEPFKVGFLSTEQCKVVYEKNRYEDKNNNKKVPDVEVSDLIYIIEKLAAGHTITIEFLAHLAKTKSWTTITLRKELGSKGFCLKYKDKYDEDRFINIQEEYEKLYDLSELNEAEQNILEAFSVFPYIPLEAEICNQWLLADAGVSKDDDILMGLYQKGWLQFDIEQESYSMHPVFAQFIYEKCKPQSEDHCRLVEECQKCLEIPESGLAFECQKYIPFAENMIEKLVMKKNMEQVIFIDSLAGLLQYVAEYKKAEELYGKSLQICKNVLGETHQSTAGSYNNLAVVYEAQAKYKEAKKLYERSLQIREKILEENHPDIADSYSNLAGIYERQKVYSKAEILYGRALRIREKTLGKEHADTIISCNDLAYIYNMEGKYSEAEELHKKVLYIREKTLGKEHLDTAISYNNLAAGYDRQGMYREAGELYKESLYIREKILGKEHPITAISYNNVAWIYMNLGEYGDALAYYLKAYKVFLYKLGLDHPSTQLVHGKLKEIYEKCGPESSFEQWLKEKMKESDDSS